MPKSVLASYRFARPPAQHAEWFQQAVRDIVRHVDRTPFLQLVQLGGLTPRFTTVPVAESVVPVPEVGGCGRVVAGAAPECVGPVGASAHGHRALVLALVHTQSRRH